MKRIKTHSLMAIAGILFLLGGIYCFLFPLSAYVKMVRYAGSLLLINGLFLLVSTLISAEKGNGSEKERKWMQAESIVDFVFGILLLFNPLFSFIVFPFLIACCMIAVGALKVLAALSLKREIQGWVFISVMGILLFLFGLLVVYFPFARAHHLPFLLGIFCLLLGGLALYDSFRFKNRKDTLDMLF